jgi:hypothetical protein
VALCSIPITTKIKKKKESTAQTGERYIPCMTPLTTPQEHNPAEPLGRLNPPTKILKSINREL